MENLNTLTIAIVTYKRIHKLELCLKSISSQRYLPKTILIIDNDYHRSSQNIFIPFRLKPLVKYSCEPKKGISHARNMALKLCSSKYLAFIDDDCLLCTQWSLAVFETLKKQPNKFAFFQGKSIPHLSSNNTIKAHYKFYQQWINQHRKSQNTYNPIGIDTKNLILNTDQINANLLTFDTNLPIFEDVDFGLQLTKKKLTGIYISQILVKHQETTSLIELIKKYYYRGQVKYFLNKKWKNFDHFTPSFNLKQLLKINSIIDFYQFILEYSFILGYKKSLNKQQLSINRTIYIINSLDHAANEERASTVSNFLQQHQYKTEIIDSEKIFNENLKVPIIKSSSPIFTFIYHYIKDNLICRRGYTWLIPLSFYLSLILRGKLIKEYLIKIKARLVISQYPEDMITTFTPRPYKLILDIPTIYSKEISLSHRFPQYLNKIINSLENQSFRQSDAVCFHWQNFLNYAQLINKKINHPFINNWGCHDLFPKTKFKPTPKIIYLGKLNSEWINPPLLQKLKTQSTDLIDIFSYEKPNKYYYSTHLSTQHAPNLSIVSDYQFGLITCTNDELRNHGFSAKQMIYLSYGIPILCPEWRIDPLLKSATIYYNERNFLQQVRKYQSRPIWTKKHLAALKLAKKYNWSETLKPLLNKIHELS